MWLFYTHLCEGEQRAANTIFRFFLGQYFMSTKVFSTYSQCCAALCVFLCSVECSSNVGGCHALVVVGGKGGCIGRQAAGMQETLDVPYMYYCNN